MSISPSLIQEDQNVGQESDGLDKHQDVNNKPDIVIKLKMLKKS